MDMGLGFLGTYITAAELVGKEPTLTVDRVLLEKVESLKADDGASSKIKDRVIVYFRESKGDRGWLLNRTNAECIKELWGRETNDWIGHKLTLYTTQVRVGPKMEPGIRIKGSPELTEPRAFELRLPRKKPIRTTLVPTGKKPPPAARTSKTLAQFKADVDNATDAEIAALVLDEARDVLTPTEHEDLAEHYRTAWS